MSNDSLGDRIKRFEAVSKLRLMPKMPVIIRVDGKAFHTFTRGCDRPFDSWLHESMVSAAEKVAKEIQGFKCAYVQSDEVTFALTDYDTRETDSWFGYEIPKLVSVSAALMTAHFNYFFAKYKGTEPTTRTCAVFDSRAFNVPIHDVPNVFVWRAKDWHRNSVQMYARAHFAHKALHGMKLDDIHEMLYTVGKNWTTDLNPQEKNGTFLIGKERRADILPTYENINGIIGPLFAPPESL